MNTPTLWLGKHQVVIADMQPFSVDFPYVKVERVDGGALGFTDYGHASYTDIVERKYLIVKVG